MLSRCHGASEEEELAAMRPGGTRVPTPNTRVKARAADGTVLGTAWESRWLPDTFLRWENKDTKK